MPMVSLVVYKSIRGLGLLLPTAPIQAHSIAQVLAGLPIILTPLIFMTFFVGALREEWLCFTPS